MEKKKRGSPFGTTLETWLTPWCSALNTDHMFYQRYMGLKTKDSIMAGLTVDDNIMGNLLLMTLSFMCITVSQSSHVYDNLVEQKTGFLGCLVIFTFGFEDIKKKRDTKKLYLCLLHSSAA